MSLTITLAISVWTWMNAAMSISKKPSGICLTDGPDQVASELPPKIRPAVGLIPRAGRIFALEDHMPVAKKETSEKTETAMCDNHPQRKAEHTTTTDLHQPISLCKSCLTRLPFMGER